MRLHSSLAFVATTVALGAAFAQPSAPLAAPQTQGTPLERLEVLEKRVAELDAQLAALRPGKGGAAEQEAEAAKAKAMAKQMDEVLAYLGAQAEAAKRLDEKLKESEDKGFTWGINPESRVALLTGFSEFSATLRKDVPTAKGAGSAQGATASR